MALYWHTRTRGSCAGGIGNTNIFKMTSKSHKFAFPVCVMDYNASCLAANRHAQALTFALPFMVLKTFAMRSRGWVRLSKFLSDSLKTSTKSSLTIHAKLDAASDSKWKTCEKLLKTLLSWNSESDCEQRSWASKIFYCSFWDSNV